MSVNRSSLLKLGRLNEELSMQRLKTNDVVRLNNGNYKIIENLVGGGQGNVWKAECNGSYFAIKIPLATASEKRAKKEIELMSKISHDDAKRYFIAPCFDTGTYLGKPVLVTPFYPDNLDNHMPVVGSNRELPDISQCLRWLWQIFCALEKIHSLLDIKDNSLVHRDLKPNNLCLDEKGDIRVIDFGIARQTHQLSTHTRSHSETSVAPEQVYPCSWKDNKPQFNLGVHVDIYALGLIAFRLFTGKFPKSQSDLSALGGALKSEKYRSFVETMSGKIGGLSDAELPQLLKAVKIRLAQESVELANEEAFCQKIVDIIHSLLAANYKERPSVNEAKSQIGQLISELTPGTFVDPFTNKVTPRPGIPLKPFAVVFLGISIVALVWQWPQLKVTWQLWQAERQLNHGIATEQQAAWRTLNQLVNVSESEAAAEILADFEQETQRLLNSNQPEEQRAAISRLYLSAEKGDPNAMLWLAYVKIKGQGTEVDWSEAERWYEKAAAFNNPEAKKRLQRLRLEMQNPIATPKLP